ncbi:MAG TPA: serine hydrolase [Candidatus Kapabacteria bacterium]|nr:serine hydrolase [Candidatus Kapabacteria bacterium]
MRYHLLLLLLLAGLGVAPASAQLPANTSSPELLRRLEDLRHAINGEVAPDSIFTQQFTSQVPPAKLREVFSQIVEANGRCISLTVSQPSGLYAGMLAARFEKNMIGTLQIAVEHTKPYRISGLLFKGLKPADGRPENLDSLVATLKGLPGTTGLEIVRLSDGKVIASHNAERPLALGSAFKLYILGELIDRASTGQARWSDVIAFDSARYAQPGSTLGKWPAGALVTLHTVATLMISQSDNTATDVLLFTLGREAVEARLRVMGNHSIAANVPFLSTREAFKLKSSNGADLLARFIPGDSTKRRAVLRELESLKVQYDFGDSPASIDRVEWFASAGDMCAAMNWLRLATQKDSTGRGVLGVNPGLSFADDRWAYVGYKGGSEPGVLNMTWLLRSKSGTWYAFSSGWNNPAASLDETAFFNLIQRILNTGPWE